MTTRACLVAPKYFSRRHPPNHPSINSFHLWLVHEEGSWTPTADGGCRSGEHASPHLPRLAFQWKEPGVMLGAITTPISNRMPSQLCTWAHCRPHSDYGFMWKHEVTTLGEISTDKFLSATCLSLYFLFPFRELHGFHAIFVYTVSISLLYLVMVNLLCPLTHIALCSFYNH